jgi:hypothetical protein
MDQGICLREFLEQFRLLFSGQADAGIRVDMLDPVASVRHLAQASSTSLRRAASPCAILICAGYFTPRRSNLVLQE